MTKNKKIKFRDPFVLLPTSMLAFMSAFMTLYLITDFDMGSFIFLTPFMLLLAWAIHVTARRGMVVVGNRLRINGELRSSTHTLTDLRLSSAGSPGWVKAWSLYFQIAADEGEDTRMADLWLVPGYSFGDKPPRRLVRKVKQARAQIGLDPEDYRLSRKEEEEIDSQM